MNCVREPHAAVRCHLSAVRYKTEKSIVRQRITNSEQRTVCLIQCEKAVVSAKLINVSITATNSALKSMNLALTFIDSALKSANAALKLTNLALTLMNLAPKLVNAPLKLTNLSAALEHFY